MDNFFSISNQQWKFREMSPVLSESKKNTVVVVLSIKRGRYQRDAVWLIVAARKCKSRANISVTTRLSTLFWGLRSIFAARYMTEVGLIAQWNNLLVAIEMVVVLDNIIFIIVARIIIIIMIEYHIARTIVECSSYFSQMMKLYKFE